MQLQDWTGYSALYMCEHRLGNGSRVKIALMHVVIVMSWELARESLSNGCSSLWQVKVQSACCCQVWPLRSVRCPTCCVSRCSSIRRKLPDLGLSFFLLSARREVTKIRSKLMVNRGVTRHICGGWATHTQRRSFGRVAQISWQNIAE